MIGGDQKREGDGASPIGLWPMRRVFYRPDRLERPKTGLPIVPLQAHDGWCDAAGHPLYNLPVSRPFEASHEALWREDQAYDLIVELGYNDTPVIDQRGSAIFFHLSKPGFPPTEGCIAIARFNMLAVLRLSQAGTLLEIKL